MKASKHSKLSEVLGRQSFIWDRKFLIYSSIPTRVSVEIFSGDLSLREGKDAWPLYLYIHHRVLTRQSGAIISMPNRFTLSICLVSVFVVSCNDTIYHKIASCGTSEAISTCSQSRKFSSFYLILNPLALIFRLVY